MDIDVVPMGELVGNDAPGHGIVVHQILDRLVGKDHAPAEGHALRVPFKYVDVMASVAKFHGNREIEAGRSSSDACNPQAAASHI